MISKKSEKDIQIAVWAAVYAQSFIDQFELHFRVHGTFFEAAKLSSGREAALLADLAVNKLKAEMHSRGVQKKDPDLVQKGDTMRARQKP